MAITILNKIRPDRGPLGSIVVLRGDLDWSSFNGGGEVKD